MGGGLMQLVAYGAQDVYLTGNPQITFFKVVYRRHTNFSKELIEQTFNGSVGPNKKVSCTISRNGDLVQEMYLYVKTGANAVTGADANDCIKTVELEIGGQKIDKHYTQWLDIYNDLFVSDEEHAYRFALAKGTGSALHILPLRFWFCRNPGLALPLIALQYHEVKVNIEFGDKMCSSNDVLDNASLFVNYVYLDTDERRRFAQVSHEYLIEQVQYTGQDSLASKNNQIRLNYNHPVKMLAWRVNATVMGNVKLQLNGHDRFSAQDADYFHLLQPMEHGMGHSKVLSNTGFPNLHTSGTKTEQDDKSKVANEIYARKYVAVDRHTAKDEQNTFMYSFALRPKEHQPSGTCNFSRIDNAVLNMDATGGTDGAAGSVDIFAVNYNVLRIMSGMGGLAYSN